GIGRDSSKLGTLSGLSNFNFISFDLSNLEQIENLFTSKFGSVKFSSFIHCAGLEETLPLSLYSVSRIQAIFSINVFSAIEILRILMKKKYSEDGGSLVLLS